MPAFPEWLARRPKATKPPVGDPAQTSALFRLLGPLGFESDFPPRALQVLHLLEIWWSGRDRYLGDRGAFTGRS